jgi:hypothetical protein
MEKFDLKQDWKFIAWGSTLLINLLRAVGAGVVWMIIMLISRNTSMGLGSILTLPLILPIAYFVILLPLGLASMSLNRAGVSYVGLVSIVCSLVIIPGDPVVWIFDQATGHKYLPVKQFGFMNFTVIVVAINEEKKAAAMMRPA